MIWKTTYEIVVLSTAPIAPDEDVSDVLMSCEQDKAHCLASHIDSKKITPWEAADIVADWGEKPGVLGLPEAEEKLYCRHCEMEFELAAAVCDHSLFLCCPNCLGELIVDTGKEDS